MKTGENNRIDWIDCAKGIGMFLVILGHTVSQENATENLIRGSIFSFHMPLFFILSCTTFRFSEGNGQFVQKTKRAFRHLIIPALIIYLLRIIIYIVNNAGTIGWKGFLTEKINVLIYSSGSDVNISGVVIPAFGMMWFFVVLFIGRSLFDYLHLNLKNTGFIVSICICTLLGIGIGMLQWIPLSFDIALAVMPFFLFGSYLKRIDISKRSILFCFVSFAVWCLSFAVIYFGFHDYLELTGRRYPVFPLCYIAAIAGTMFVAYLSKMISGFVLAKPITYIGRYSLYFFCVHAMDYLYRFVWNRTGNNIINGIIRICIDFVVTMILIKIISGLSSFIAKRKNVAEDIDGDG